ncbi:hypothetical protein ACSQ67_004089 [Phaseolus vulgaris]
MGIHKGDGRDPRASHSGRKRDGGKQETLVYYGDLNMVNECGYGSYVSVSSSDTYVEETAFSTRSGEEEIRSGFREVVRSKGEEVVGETAEDGERVGKK